MRCDWPFKYFCFRKYASKRTNDREPSVRVMCSYMLIGWLLCCNSRERYSIRAIKATSARTHHRRHTIFIDDVAWLGFGDHSLLFAQFFDAVRIPYLPFTIYVSSMHTCAIERQVHSSSFGCRWTKAKMSNKNSARNKSHVPMVCESMKI